MQLLQMTGFPDNLEIRENAHNESVTFSSQRMLVEFEKNSQIRDMSGTLIGSKKKILICMIFFPYSNSITGKLMCATRNGQNNYLGIF